MSDNRVLLDLTTLITLVSDCCTQKNLIDRYGEKWKIVKDNIYDQLIDEERDPVYPKLMNLLNNKDILVVRSCYDKFIDMISVMGSETEIKNMKILKDRLKIIEPEPSRFFCNLKDKKKWNQENIDTFGTADTHKLFIVTGNKSVAYFLQSKSDRINFSVQLHRSRSFIGKRKYERLDQST